MRRKYEKAGLELMTPGRGASWEEVREIGRKSLKL